MAESSTTDLGAGSVGVGRGDRFRDGCCGVSFYLPERTMCALVPYVCMFARGSVSHYSAQ